MRVLVALALAASALAVDRSKFRTCNDAGFCRRHRSKAAEPEVGERAGATAPRRAAPTLTCARPCALAPSSTADRRARSPPSPLRCARSSA
jgi:hypothetical protein